MSETGSENSGTPATAPATEVKGEVKAEVKGEVPFYSTFQNAELKEFAEKRGWKDPEKVVESYREFEKFQGVPKDQIIKVPKDENDKEGWDAVYTKIGRPETSDKYELPVPEGQDPAFAAEVSKWMFDSGIPKKSAQALATKWNEYVVESQKTALATFQATGEKELAELKVELGNAFDSSMEQGKRLFAQVGIDADTSNMLEQALGTGKYLRLMSKMGSLIAESSFVEGKTGHVNWTPAAAQTEIAALIKDKEFQQRMKNKDVDALKKWQDLNKAIVGVK
jgi:hypothetical protein